MKSEYLKCPGVHSSHDFKVGEKHCVSFLQNILAKRRKKAQILLSDDVCVSIIEFRFFFQI